MILCVLWYCSNNNNVCVLLNNFFIKDYLYLMKKENGKNWALKFLSYKTNYNSKSFKLFF